MAWPGSLAVALKEWATVCRALETGRQIVLLRKGGIFESGGEFKLEHRQFLLFPTYVHQNVEMLKPEARHDLEVRAEEPQHVSLRVAGDVTDILLLDSPAQMDALDDEHVWAAPLIDLRFNYRPANPLYLLLVRTYRLPDPVAVDNVPAYAGCKSWVPQEQSIPTSAAVPVLDETRYDGRRQEILRRLRRN